MSTYGSLIRDAARRLGVAGVEDARREALTIAASLRRESPGRLWLARRARVADEFADRYAEAVGQRASGAPTAYAIGTAAFRFLELAVDGRVLIPRPETEGLVDHVLAWARDRPPSSAIASQRRGGTQRGGWGVAADIGTGSGCIALSLALEGRFDRIVATDVDAGALQVAAGNDRRGAPPLDATDRPSTPVEFRQGDLLAPLAGTVVDALVSNPPYLSEREWGGLDPGVRGHEPRRALVSGPDGLAATRVLIDRGPAVVTPGGLLAIEIDCRRADAVLECARRAGWADPRIERDLFERPRYLLATRERA